MSSAFKYLSLRKWISPGSVEAYAFATVCVVLATLLRWFFGHLAADILYFPTFYPAVLFAALIGGIGPGVFAALLGGLIGWSAFMTPEFGLVRPTPGQQISLLLYLCSAICIVWGADHYRRIAQLLAEEEVLRKLSVEELAHRLRNKLATIQGIIRFRLREHPHIGKEIIASLDALSATDELIMATQGQGARLSDIIAHEILPYEVSRATFEGPNVVLPPKLALITALLIHELVTNAVKYGALSNASGRVSIRWSIVDGRLVLEWRETGGPRIVDTPTNQGFGTRLFSSALEQFGGTSEADFAPSGLVRKFSFMMPENSSSTTPDVTARLPGAVAAD